MAPYDKDSLTPALYIALHELHAVYSGHSEKGATRKPGTGQILRAGAQMDQLITDFSKIAELRQRAVRSRTVYTGGSSPAEERQVKGVGLDVRCGAS